MAKIKVLGEAMTLTSNMKAETIAKAERYCPEALKLIDEEKKPYFIVQMGAPSVSKFGVSFSNVNSEGKAYNTIVGFDKETIKEDFAEVLFNLNKVEDNVNSAIEKLEERIRTIEDAIEIID